MMASSRRAGFNKHERWRHNLEILLPQCLKSHEAVHAPSGEETGAFKQQGGEILLSGLRRKSLAPQQEPPKSWVGKRR